MADKRTPVRIDDDVLALIERAKGTLQEKSATKVLNNYLRAILAPHRLGGQRRLYELVAEDTREWAAEEDGADPKADLHMAAAEYALAG